MRRFFVLLRKEIVELLTPQIILPFVITIGIFAILGNLVGDQAEALERRRMLVADLDGTTASKQLLESARKSGFEVVRARQETLEEGLAEARERGIGLLLIVPRGFGRHLADGAQAKLVLASTVTNFSMSAAEGSQQIKALVEALNDAARRQFVASNAPGVSVEAALRPIDLEEHVAVGDRIARVSVEQVMGFVSTQTMFIPIILFLVLAFASQMIATAVASEKENKTLETLLSMPVDRRAIVAAKMLAAGLVALLGAFFYIFGFRYYLDNLSGGGLSNAASNAGRFVEQLGLAMEPAQYALLGLSLFFGILCALAISIILGAFAEDVKSVSVAVTPIMVLVLIPYFLTMLVGVDNLPLAVRYAVLAIPFSHPFLAASYLFLRNWGAVVAGIAYQAVFFAVSLSAAARIFASDRILTIKLRVRRGAG